MEKIYASHLTFIYEDDGQYIYCYKSFKNKRNDKYFQIGWPFIHSRNVDDIGFIINPKKIYISPYWHLVNLYCVPNMKYVYIAFPIKLNRFEIIAPLNQYDEGIENQDLIKIITKC